MRNSSIPNPSPLQEQIFDWFQNPTTPRIVNAVAGGAKTSTIVEGLHRLSQSGDKLFAAFNSSIVAELRKRLPNTVDCNTFHSIGRSALVRAYPNVRKWDVEKGNLKYRQMARDIKVDRNIGDPKAVQDAVLSLLNYAQVTGAELSEEGLLEIVDRFGVELPAGFPIDQAVSVVKSMLEHGLVQAESGLISYSDMLWIPMYKGLKPKQYDFVAVDECQDMNKVQMWLMENVLRPSGKFIAVGDPRQAIYMFAGAEADSFFQIKDYFGADEMELSFCYRCPQAVIAEAQKIVPQITCPPGTREGIVATIEDAQFKNMLKRGDMVLCRLTAPLVKLCFQLLGQKIPAKIKGRDIGAQIANTVKQVMRRENDMSQFPTKLYAWEEYQLDLLRQKFGSEDQQESVKDRVAALEICYTTLNPFGVESFMAGIKDLFSDDASPVTLSTVHRAKGLENPRVFIIRPDKLPLTRKGMTPAQMVQEDNLKYVAVTRAKEELYFVTPGVEDKQAGSNPGIPGITI